MTIGYNEVEEGTIPLHQMNPRNRVEDGAHRARLQQVEMVRAPSLLFVFITYFLVLIRHNKMFWANQHFLKFLILRTIKV